jgi:hypothetical protein
MEKRSIKGETAAGAARPLDSAFKARHTFLIMFQSTHPCEDAT